MSKIVIVLLVAALLVVGLNTFADAARSPLAQRVAELEEGYDFLKAQIWFVCDAIRREHGICPWGFPKEEPNG